MNFRDVTAAKCVSEVQKRVLASAVARGEGVCDHALVNVGCAGVEIGCGAVGDGSEREIKGAVFGAASAKEIAAVADAGVVELSPGIAAVERFPYALIVAVCIDVPDIHFAESGGTGAVGNDGDFPAINGACFRRSFLRGALSGGEPGAGLIYEAGPGDPIRRR